LGQIFAHLDGDNVGNRLELLLLDERLDDACKYSESVTKALQQVRAFLIEVPTVRVLIAEGDDLLATWQPGSVKVEDIDEMRKIFLRNCGQSMSAGVGFSTSSAVRNLRRAKLMGKAQVIYEPESL
jgi:hypothetical protein